MFKFKSSSPYWEQFSSYQSFNSVDEMVKQIKIFESTYEVTPAVKAVLNTLKLHSKRYFGVCWLYREEIARKAKVSLSSVKRAIKMLQEIGLLTVHQFIHTKRGGQTHNIYVINSIFEPEEKPANEPPSEDVSEPSETVVAKVSDDRRQSHKNLNTNSNTKTLKISIEKFDILRNVPNEFIDLMEPFYANNPDLIHARWKTVLSAAKKSCIRVRQLNWNTVKDAWTDVIKVYKRGKIKNSTDDGIGGYFYGVLCDYFVDDFLRLHA